MPVDEGVNEESAPRDEPPGGRAGAVSAPAEREASPELSPSGNGVPPAVFREPAIVAVSRPAGPDAGAGPDSGPEPGQDGAALPEGRRWSRWTCRGTASRR